jgi:hypothetical protein
MTQAEELTGEDRSILRWGGLAGIVGGIVFIFVPVILFGFLPPTPADPIGLVTRFPEIRSTLAAGNFVNFVAGTLWVAFFLGLYRALRRTSAAPALWGTSLGLLGLAVLFVETTTQVAFDPISSIYVNTGVTPQNQFVLVAAWQATQGMFNQFDTSATCLLSVCFSVLGVAMLRAPAFGRVIGGVSMVFGVAALLTVATFGITSSLAAVVAVPIFIVFPILLGWKVYHMSRTA